MERAMNFLTDFAKGIIAGFILAVIIFGSVAVVMYLRNKDKEKIEYVELQQGIETLREDYVNRDPAEFLEIPDVRRAANNARDEFDRKRAEALYRFRNRLVD
jgi:flagellar biosynthesis/type III secretory pathway M-ring protein FliF/YscJ